MKYKDLNKITKLYFGYEEVARSLNIGLSSARVSANRYVKQGLLVRVKRNMYVLSGKWQSLSREETFTIANVIQVPSYISLITALEYYSVTTQVQREFIESVAVKRTVEFETEETVFNYSKIAQRFYFGFSRGKGFFIASPEKALLDALYLMSLKRYNIDLTAIDAGKLNKKQLQKLSGVYPERTRKMVDAIWKT